MMGHKIHPNTLVLVVDAEGASLGKMIYSEAERLADSESLDLVEVSRNKEFVVYKIMNQGKWAYERKKTKKQKPQQKNVTKTIRFRPTTDAHDKETKLKQLLKFIGKGYSVNVVVLLTRGEKSHPEFGRETAQSICDELGDQIRSDEVKQGKAKRDITFSFVAHPIKGIKHAKTEDSKDHERRTAKVPEHAEVSR